MSGFHEVRFPDNIAYGATHEFWRRFEEVRPLILGALLDVVAAGLARMPDVRLNRMPRMADFAKWITACEPALGWCDGEFMEIYAINRAAMTEMAIESDETIKMIRDEPICHGEHESVGSLLEKLRVLCSEDRDKRAQLPKSPRALSGLLRRYAPGLRAIGLEVSFGTHGRIGNPVNITRKEKAPARASHVHDVHEIRDSEASSVNIGVNVGGPLNPTFTATFTESAKDSAGCERCERVNVAPATSAVATQEERVRQGDPSPSRRRVRV
jgi:hypothetical protein